MIFFFSLCTYAFTCNDDSSKTLKIKVIDKDTEALIKNPVLLYMDFCSPSPKKDTLKPTRKGKHELKCYPGCEYVVISMADGYSSEAISFKGAEMIEKKEVVIELIRSSRNMDIDSSRLKE